MAPPPLPWIENACSHMPLAVTEVLAKFKVGANSSDFTSSDIFIRPDLERFEKEWIRKQSIETGGFDEFFNSLVRQEFQGFYELRKTLAAVC